MTGTEIVEYEPQAGTLALRGDQVEWSPVQQAALAHIGIDKAGEADQQVFRHVCQRVGLDPFARQIHMICRSERQKDGSYKDKWTIQTGIDGFRLIAERHDQYAGTLDPEWCGQDGVWREAWVENKPPVMARVKILRRDRQHPITLPVRFSEFAATFKDGNLQGQWKSMPAHMIAKVAEAAALRKAFPQDFSGLYTDDEMQNTGRQDRPDFDHRDAGRSVTAAELTGQEPPRPDSTAGGDERAAAPTGSPGPPPADQQQPDEPKASDGQIRYLGGLFGEGKVSEEDRHLLTGLLLDSDVVTWSTLTAPQANRVIERMNEMKKAGHEHGLAGAVDDLLNAAEQKRMEAEAAEQEQGQAGDAAAAES